MRISISAKVKMFMTQQISYITKIFFTGFFVQHICSAYFSSSLNYYTKFSNLSKLRETLTI